MEEIEPKSDLGGFVIVFVTILVVIFMLCIVTALQPKDVDYSYHPALFDEDVDVNCSMYLDFEDNKFYYWADDCFWVEVNVTTGEQSPYKNHVKED